MSRTPWAELPGTCRAAVTDIVGPAVAVVDVPHGITCSTAAILTTPSGGVFVKGTPSTDRDAVDAQDAEVAVNPRTVGPRLLGSIEAGGWYLLVFEAIPGARHADLTPGSPDLDAVARTLAAASTVRPPTPDVPALGDRWARHLDDAERELLRGDTLVHADPNPHNLVVDDAGTVHLVDWAMARVGPAWADVACAYLHLLYAGHTPAAAHSWAARVPAWREADPAAVAAFVRGMSGEWVDAVGDVAARRGIAEFESLVDAGAVHRAG